MAKKACQLCGANAMHHTIKEMEYHYKKHSTVVQQPGEYCDECCESILSPSDLKATRKELAAFKAEIDHLLTPDQIKAARRSLKLNQQEAANICGGGKNAFSRYESGEFLIPRAASNLLSVLTKEKSLLSFVSREAA